MISPIPFLGPLGAVRLALRDGEWVPFPTYEDLEESVFELVVAGKRNAAGEVDIAMVEAGATEDGHRLVTAGAPASDEETVARGLELAKEYIGVLIDMQVELAAQAETPTPIEYPLVIDYSQELYDQVAGVARDRLMAMGTIADKHERQDAEDMLREEVLAELAIAEDDEAASRLPRRPSGPCRRRSCARGSSPKASGWTVAA